MSELASRPELHLRSVPEFLSTIPLLCGFQPGDGSMVAVGTRGRESEAAIVARYDIPGPPGDLTAADAAGVARHMASVFAAGELNGALVTCYGPESQVTPAAAAVAQYLPEAGVEVRLLLRVEGPRYWSRSPSGEWLPAGGSPFNPRDRMIVPGAPRVLDSREALEAAVAAVAGEEAASMARATRAAEKRARRLAGRAHDVARVRAEGLKAVGGAVARYRAGGTPLTHDEAAWLALSLGSPRVRDDAWARMDPAYREAHARLWTDLTRLAGPGDVAPAASLLAFTAWQGGNGALANVALDRALADDPAYSMARMIRTAVSSGAPPALARLPMTPEEVAAAYAARGA